MISKQKAKKKKSEICTIMIKVFNKFCIKYNTLKLREYDFNSEFLNATKGIVLINVSVIYYSRIKIMIRY